MEIILGWTKLIVIKLNFVGIPWEKNLDKISCGHLFFFWSNFDFDFSEKNQFLRKAKFLTVERDVEFVVGKNPKVRKDRHRTQKKRERELKKVRKERDWNTVK